MAQMGWSDLDILEVFSSDDENIIFSKEFSDERDLGNYLIYALLY